MLSTVPTCSKGSEMLSGDEAPDLFRLCRKDGLLRAVFEAVTRSTPDDLSTEQTRDALGNPVQVKVAQELQRTLHKQDGEIQAAQTQQQFDLRVGHGIVDDPPLQFERHQGQRQKRQREQAEPDLLPTAHSEDVGIKRRRHRPAGPIVDRGERPPAKSEQRAGHGGVLPLD